jgi:hypothetical protein
LKIVNCNIVSVSWGDHFVFGEGDGRLDSLPAVRRRMRKWQNELGTGIIHWRCTRDKIVEKGIIDHLVIDQNSSQCPSMRHDLWPMRRGYGYLQNYLNGINMNTLEEDLTRIYQPVLTGRDTKLYLHGNGRSAHPKKNEACLDTRLSTDSFSALFATTTLDQFVAMIGGHDPRWRTRLQKSDDRRQTAENRYKHHCAITDGSLQDNPAVNPGCGVHPGFLLFISLDT